jgi:hypothetical protein
MDHFAGLNVSVKYTGVCVVDSMGFGSSKVASEPDAQLRAASGKWRFVVGSTCPLRWTSMGAARQYNDVGRNLGPFTRVFGQSQT